MYGIFTFVVNVGKDSIHGAYGNHWLKLSESHHFAPFLLLPRMATTKVVDKSQCTCRQGQPNWYETKLPCARMWYLLILLYVDWSLTRLSWPLNEFVLWLLTYLIGLVQQNMAQGIRCTTIQGLLLNKKWHRRIMFRIGSKPIHVTLRLKRDFPRRKLLAAGWAAWSLPYPPEI